MDQARLRRFETSTHYDILGVAPGASHDEVKRAYTELALRYHPDRNSFPNDESRQLAEYRMREINEAWRVLRNPATRAAYDASLRRANPHRVDTATSRPSQMPTVRPATQGPTLNATASDAIATVADGAGSAPPMRFGPVVFGIVLIACLLIVAFIAGVPNSTTDDELQVETRERFAIGSCVVVSPSEVGLVPIEVPCSTSGASRIVSRVDYPRPCPLGTTLVRIPGEQLALCLQ
ncbi:MAG: J domain-containing protein [Acidimicrobiales bacterium]|nr:J domain-containing protein [Acidimicrobiales bacterium]